MHKFILLKKGADLYGQFVSVAERELAALWYCGLFVYLYLLISVLVCLLCVLLISYQILVNKAACKWMFTLAANWLWPISVWKKYIKYNNMITLFSFPMSHVHFLSGKFPPGFTLIFDLLNFQSCVTYCTLPSPISTDLWLSVQSDRYHSTSWGICACVVWHDHTHD